MKQTLRRNDTSGRRLKPKTLRANKSGEREAIFFTMQANKTVEQWKLNNTSLLKPR